MTSKKKNEQEQKSQGQDAVLKQRIEALEEDLKKLRQQLHDAGVRFAT